MLLTDFMDRLRSLEDEKDPDVVTCESAMVLYDVLDYVTNELCPETADEIYDVLTLFDQVNGAK